MGYVNETELSNAEVGAVLQHAHMPRPVAYCSKILARTLHSCTEHYEHGVGIRGLGFSN